MSVKNIYHRTRDRIYKMNFSESGETSWSFIAETDGEIYNVESNNIDSYTINGASITLPFSIELGNTYVVSITKTNTGEVADIVLKSRRSQEKITSQNVPDFGSYDGRYLYVLTDNNQITQIDSQLLDISNYEGSGIWTISPIIGTVNLTPPTNLSFHAIHFGNGKIMAMINDRYSINKFCISLIDESLNVTDLDGNLDTYTQIYRYVLSGEGIRGVGYDYINNIVVLSAPGDSWSISVDLNARISYAYDANTVPSHIIRFLPKPTTFIPEKELFAFNGDLKIPEGYCTNFKNVRNEGWTYNRDNGSTYAMDIGARVKGFDLLGTSTDALQSSVNIGCKNIKYIGSGKFIGFYPRVSNNILFIDNNGDTIINITTLDGYEGSDFFDISICPNHVIFKDANSTTKRLFVFDHINESYIGYLDLPNIILSIASNRHI